MDTPPIPLTRPRLRMLQLRVPPEPSGDPGELPGAVTSGQFPARSYPTPMPDPLDPIRAAATVDATRDGRGRANYRVAAAALGVTVEQLRAVVPDGRGRPRATYSPATIAAVVAARETAGSVKGAARALGRSEEYVRAVLVASKSAPDKGTEKIDMGREKKY